LPGRLFLTTPLAALAEELGVPPGALADEPPRANISPGQQIVIFDGTGLAHMRWGIIPVGRVNARGRPVMETLINARSETVFDKSAFAGTGRAVVPVNGWYEWTGEKRRKTAWRIAPKDGGYLYFAAITDLWQAPGGLQVPQVAMLTSPLTKENGRLTAPEFPHETDACSGECDVRSAFAAVAACFDIEGHFLVVGQTCQACPLNCGNVNKDILAAPVRGNKAVAFGRVEPFYGTRCHGPVLLS
jgi:hypothetical protein